MVLGPERRVPKLCGQWRVHSVLRGQTSVQLLYADTPADGHVQVLLLQQRQLGDRLLGATADNQQCPFPLRHGLNQFYEMLLRPTAVATPSSSVSAASLATTFVAAFAIRASIATIGPATSGPAIAPADAALLP